MEKLLFFVAIFLLSFSNFAFGQNQEKDTFFFNYQKGDYEGHFFVGEFNPDTTREAWIIIPYLDAYPAEFSECGKIISLSQPSDIWFWVNMDYACYAGFYDIYGRIVLTKNVKFDTPKLKLTIDWNIKDNTLYVNSMLNDINLDNLYVNSKETSFIIIHDKEDVPDEADRFQYFEAREEGDSFSGEWPLDQDIGSDLRKNLWFSVEVQDSSGKRRFLAGELTSFVKTQELKIFHNVTGVGAVTPYWKSSKEEKAHLVNTSGTIVSSFVARSDEPLWFLVPAGIYFLIIENVGTAKIIKHDY